MHVSFAEQEAVYLIAEMPTGVTYQAQAGGHACSQPEIVGAIVTVCQRGAAGDIEAKMCALDRGVGMTAKNADAADRVLADVTFECLTRIRNLRIDRDRLDEIEEGWWRVVWEQTDSSAYSFPGREVDEGWTPMRGVLCGPNCD